MKWNMRFGSGRTGVFEARYLAGRDKQGRKRYASCYGATKEGSDKKSVTRYAKRRLRPPEAVILQWMYFIGNGAARWQAAFLLHQKKVCGLCRTNFTASFKEYAYFVFNRGYGVPCFCTTAGKPMLVESYL